MKTFDRNILFGINIEQNFTIAVVEIGEFLIITNIEVAGCSNKKIGSMTTIQLAKLKKKDSIHQYHGKKETHCHFLHHQQNKSINNSAKEIMQFLFFNHKKVIHIIIPQTDVRRLLEFHKEGINSLIVMTTCASSCYYNIFNVRQYVVKILYSLITAFLFRLLISKAILFCVCVP